MHNNEILSMAQISTLKTAILSFTSPEIPSLTNQILKNSKNSLICHINLANRNLIDNFLL